MEKKIEDIAQDVLNDNDLDDVLEQFDITPADVILLLINRGLLDEEEFKNIYYV